MTAHVSGDARRRRDRVPAPGAHRRQSVLHTTNLQTRSRLQVGELPRRLRPVIRSPSNGSQRTTVARTPRGSSCGTAIALDRGTPWLEASIRRARCNGTCLVDPRSASAAAARDRALVRRHRGILQWRSRARRVLEDRQGALSFESLRRSDQRDERMSPRRRRARPNSAISSRPPHRRTALQTVRCTERRESGEAALSAGPPPRRERQKRPAAKGRAARVRRTDESLPAACERPLLRVSRQRR